MDKQILVQGDFGKYYSRIRDHFKELEKLGVSGMNTQLPNLNQETFNDSWGSVEKNLDQVVKYVKFLNSN